MKRRAISAKLSPEAHDGLHGWCDSIGGDVAALIEALGRELAEHPEWIDAAKLAEETRRIGSERRRRRKETT